MGTVIDREREKITKFSKFMRLAVRKKCKKSEEIHIVCQIL